MKEAPAAATNAEIARLITATHRALDSVHVYIDTRNEHGGRHETTCANLTAGVRKHIDYALHKVFERVAHWKDRDTALVAEVLYIRVRATRIRRQL